MAGPLVGGTYEIVVAGAVDPNLLDASASLGVWTEAGTTRFRVVLADQAALHGLLARLRDLGISILEIHRVDDT